MLVPPTRHGAIPCALVLASRIRNGDVTELAIIGGDPILRTVGRKGQG